MKLFSPSQLLLLLTLSPLAFGQGTISTLAGTGVAGFGGDSGPASNALLSVPTSVAIDAAGNVYIADSANLRIRRVTPTGVITTYAGSGTAGSEGDGGSAIGARFRNPRRVAVTANGTLYIADTGDHRIRRVAPNGTITGYAGTGNQGLSGDGALAVNALLDSPEGLAVDSAGNLYIADVGNLRVRRVTPAGVISTYAGNGNFISTGDGGQATSAGLAGPTSLAVDAANNLYIGEQGGGRIRRVTPAGIITTIAGTGTLGYTGDGGPATAARLGAVRGLAVDGAGSLLIADADNRRIRKITNGIITTEAGNGTAGSSGDGSVATFAQFITPIDVATSSSGSFAVADSGAHRIRSIGPIAPSVSDTDPFVLSGFNQTFTLRYNHPGGVGQIGVVNALINNALVGSGACYIAYSQPLGVLYLVNDGGVDVGLSAALPLGATGSVSNNQCTIFSAGSSAVASGNSLVLTLSVTFTANFMGNKVVYLAGQSITNASSGWKTVGVSIVPEGIIAFPRSTDSNPTTGNTANATVSFNYQDTTDANALQTVWALANTAVDGARACYVAYYRPGNLLFLFPDNGDGNAATSIPLSGTAEIENSQCRISTIGSGAVTVGNTLTVTLNITYKPGFPSNFGIWTAANTLSGLTSPWKIVSVRKNP